MAGALVILGVVGLTVDPAGAVAPSQTYPTPGEIQNELGDPIDTFEDNLRDAERDRERQRDKAQDRQMMWLQISLACMSVSIAVVAVRPRRQAASASNPPLPPHPMTPPYPPPGPPPGPPYPPPNPQDRRF